jgi:hypothetical protein
MSKTGGFDWLERRLRTNQNRRPKKSRKKMKNLKIFLQCLFELLIKVDFGVGKLQRFFQERTKLFVLRKIHQIAIS